MKFLIVSLLFSLTSCSLIDEPKPPLREYWDKVEEKRCEDSYDLPVIDTIIAGMGISKGIVDGLDKDQKEDQVSNLVAASFTGMLFGYSAYHGFTNANLCQEYKLYHEAKKNQVFLKPEQDGTLSLNWKREF